MEGVAGATTGRGGVSLPVPSSRPEWRVVSEHQSVQSKAEEERSKNPGRSNERTVYEGREQVNLNYCSITMNGNLDNDILQQKLHSVERQREELQQMEIGLRAKIIARSELIRLQSSYDAQIKEQDSAAVKLQEQLREREKAINELERKMEEKERELHDIKLANEVAWAKEDLLREQNKELATFRRERDNSEAEKGHHLKQIHDLQDHIQEKDRQFIELQEQNRVAQETILFKDEQLRDAQAWISRVQEMDALQLNTNHSLQAELRERMEQYNQLWLHCQRQFSEMERIHMHTVQQLQLELADARERSGAYNDETCAEANSKDLSQFGLNNGHQSDANAGGILMETSGVLANGSGISSFVSTGNASNQTDHVAGVPIAPSSILGMPAYLAPGQVAALHPFVMHQQGVQSHAGQFHSMPAVSSIPHWHNQQGISDPSQGLTNDQYPPSQLGQNVLRADANYEYEMSVNERSLNPEYSNVPVGQLGAVITPTEEAHISLSNDISYMVASQPQENLQQISSQFRDALRLDSIAENTEMKEDSIDKNNHELEPTEHSNFSANSSPSDTFNDQVNISESAVNTSAGAFLPDAVVSTAQTNSVTAGNVTETSLLDERSLLACIVRTIPSGLSGSIRISSTLPNRLGKMLSPLHWHDYKKKYGKLDDFVASHPELFVIQGDYIQLREGAQEIIAATAAVAKVAAAASASAPLSSLLPSVTVTPMAQSQRLKKVPSVDSTSVIDNVQQLSAKINLHSNGVSTDVAGGFRNVKILSKPKDASELNGFESKPVQSSALLTVGNGANHDRLVLGNSTKKLSSNGRPANFSSKQGRTTVFAGTSRR